jgi:hypothetical protein
MQRHRIATTTPLNSWTKTQTLNPAYTLWRAGEVMGFMLELYEVSRHFHLPNMAGTYNYHDYAPEFMDAGTDGSVRSPEWFSPLFGFCKPKANQMMMVANMAYNRCAGERPYLYYAYLLLYEPFTMHSPDWISPLFGFCKPKTNQMMIVTNMAYNQCAGERSSLYYAYLLLYEPFTIHSPDWISPLIGFCKAKTNQMMIVTNMAYNQCAGERLPLYHAYLLLYEPYTMQSPDWLSSLFNFCKP